MHPWSSTFCPVGVLTKESMWGRGNGSFRHILLRSVKSTQTQFFLFFFFTTTTLESHVEYFTSQTEPILRSLRISSFAAVFFSMEIFSYVVILVWTKWKASLVSPVYNRFKIGHIAFLGGTFSIQMVLIPHRVRNFTIWWYVDGKSWIYGCLIIKLYPDGASTT